MLLCRVGLSFAVAVMMATIVYFLRRSTVLREDLVAGPVIGADDHHDHRGAGEKTAAAVRAATKDFLDVTVFFVLGAAVATLFNTSVNQQVIMPLAEDRVLAVGSMMALASLLSLCSTSDAFVAATFTAFPSASKLAFLVFGPVVDLKLIFIYSLVFRKRFIVFLVAGLFLLVFGLCTFLPIPNFRG
jgi:uncharacterized membrane protein YraQ (UPF0718 family)